ncbi:hypothetical protein [Sinomicrobium weinanense]|uniref:Uncharacterized protein n=1 Tax=Sinomicrobium weinanense TaxID=2842200 RepID=A0A926JPH1_9FLAO|nr:hypothetical protein [Sinomicrobium weinanense]MBC9794974.1 hypothetical protein [Sinomicrobium weinanense]MBU3125165.1 hypothetical protein [Sinomicrobium weinanense]
MRNGLSILLTLIIFFTSSCAVKKVVMHYLDMHQGIPAKAHMPTNPAEARAAYFINCTFKSGADFQYNTNDVLAVLQTLKLQAPLLLLSSLILVFLSLHYSSPLNFRVPAQNGGFPIKIPIYKQLRQFVLYA